MVGYGWKRLKRKKGAGAMPDSRPKVGDRPWVPLLEAVSILRAYGYDVSAPAMRDLGRRELKQYGPGDRPEKILNHPLGRWHVRGEWLRMHTGESSGEGERNEG